VLAVIDTATGNIQSVVNALTRIGVTAEIAVEAATLSNADAIVLPGVGAIAPAIKLLRERGFDEAIRRRVLDDGCPLLGICLGMQLLADQSHENGLHEGLGLIPGNIVPLDPKDGPDQVPNFGWHDTAPTKTATLFNSDRTQSFYFAHSYHFMCKDDSDVAAEIDFSGERITAAVERGNIFGVQFHPEKSQDAGLDILHRYCIRVGEISSGS